jgi:hypothetical protein
VVGVFRTKMFFPFCLGGCVLIRHRLYDVMILGCGFTRGEFWGSGSGVWGLGFWDYKRGISSHVAAAYSWLSGDESYCNGDEKLDSLGCLLGSLISTA